MRFARPFPPFEASLRPTGRVALVVLGARDDPARTREAIRVFALTAPDLVIASGGLRSPSTGQEPAAHVVRKAMVESGIPSSRIIVEDRSRTTHDQAQLVAAILRREGVPHVMLVTADVHMRRAVGAFRREGIEPIAAPAGGSSASLLHELLGLVYYGARGWIR